MSAVQVQGLTVRLGAREVLRGLDLDVPAGEFLVLLGPSGCGKSTLLGIVGGLDRACAGAVSMDGAAPADLGFMFQEPRLMPWMSVLDNVLLVVPDGVRAQARPRALELLRAMELGDVLDAYPGRLSGGMMRRVALARAFVNEPALLLMDEPFVSLDSPTANRLRAMLLAQWRRCGASVLFVTHDLREALALADRICFLSPSPGRVVLLDGDDSSRHLPTQRVGRQRNSPSDWRPRTGHWTSEDPVVNHSCRAASQGATPFKRPNVSERYRSGFRAIDFQR